MGKIAVRQKPGGLYNSVGTIFPLIPPARGSSRAVIGCCIRWATRQSGRPRVIGRTHYNTLRAEISKLLKKHSLPTFAYLCRSGVEPPTGAERQPPYSPPPASKFPLTNSSSPPSKIAFGFPDSIPVRKSFTRD